MLVCFMSANCLGKLVRTRSATRCAMLTEFEIKSDDCLAGLEVLLSLYTILLEPDDLTKGDVLICGVQLNCGLDAPTFLLEGKLSAPL